MSTQMKSLGVKFLVPLDVTVLRAALPQGAKLLRVKGLSPSCRVEQQTFENDVLTLRLLSLTKDQVEVRPVVEYEMLEPKVAAIEEAEVVVVSGEDVDELSAELDDLDQHTRVTEPTLPVVEAPKPTRGRGRRA